MRADALCRTILNGNGKLPWELQAAIEAGVLVNVDSEFDFANIAAAAAAAGKPANLLLRINPDVNPKVWAPWWPDFGAGYAQLGTRQCRSVALHGRMQAILAMFIWQ